MLSDSLGREGLDMGREVLHLPGATLTSELAESDRQRHPPQHAARGITLLGQPDRVALDFRADP